MEKKVGLSQDDLTNDEINKLLEYFVEVDNVFELPLDTFVRYFTIKEIDGEAKKVFRLGGKIYKLVPEDGYVILYSGYNKWSVQISHSIFYRELKITELVNEYEEILDDYEQEIMDLKKINKKLYEKIMNGRVNEVHRNEVRGNEVARNEGGRNEVRGNEVHRNEVRGNPKANRSTHRYHISAKKTSDKLPPSKKDFMRL